MAPKSTSAALSALRDLHNKTRNVPASAVSAPRAPDKHTDFTTLPVYQEMQFALSTAAALDIAPPFFRPVSAARGTQLCIRGHWVHNFASYDYLSLNRSPDVAQAVKSAVDDWGVSATASRLVGG